MRKCSGSMTVFVSLTLLLIASLLFTLVEGARYHCLKSLADMDRITETASAFAEYDTALLEQYGLLFLDDSYGSGTENLNRIAGRIMDLSEYNLNPNTAFGSDFLRMRMMDCEVELYELATDYGGDAFRRQVVEYTKENLGTIALEEFARRMKEGEKAEEKASGLNPSGKVSAGKQTAKANREKEAAAAENGEELASNGIAPATDFENPLDFFESLMSSSPLVWVVPKDKTVSTKETDLSDSLMKRSVNVGNYPNHKSTGAADKLLYLAYLNEKFGCFTNVKENKRLDYELEYILYGRDSDRKNLESALRRILLIREATNYVYLQTDAEKKAIADSIAVAIAGVTLSPELIPIIREAILVAWSLVESMMELRTLLSGGRVAIIKTAASWKTDVLHPATSFRKGNGTDSQSGGLSYADYLFQFLLLESGQKLNYRTMDMIEQNVRLLRGTTGFRMDCMIQRMKVGYAYQAKPLFLTFVTIGDIDRGNYEFLKEQSISYLVGDG